MTTPDEMKALTVSVAAEAFRAGAKAQREADIAALRAKADEVNAEDKTTWAVLLVAAELVEQLPLVEGRTDD